MKIVLNTTALREMMEKSGEDVYRLAARIGTPPSTIYRILNGERGIGGQMIAKLMWAFDLTEKDFHKLFTISK